MTLFRSKFYIIIFIIFTHVFYYFIYVFGTVFSSSSPLYNKFVYVDDTRQNCECSNKLGSMESFCLGSQKAHLTLCAIWTQQIWRLTFGNWMQFSNQSALIQYTDMVSCVTNSLHSQKIVWIKDIIDLFFLWSFSLTHSFFVYPIASPLILNISVRGQCICVIRCQAHGRGKSRSM